MEIDRIAAVITWTKGAPQ